MTGRDTLENDLDDYEVTVEDDVSDIVPGGNQDDSDQIGDADDLGELNFD
jgi:hypothetical protein